MRRLALLLATALHLSCSGKPGRGGIEAEVRVLPGTQSRCLQLSVRGAGAAEQRSNAIAIAPGDVKFVGVGQGAFPATVTLRALAFSDSTCTVANDAESSAPVDAAFMTKPTLVVLTVGPAPGDGGVDAGQPDGGTDGGVDLDGDGWSAQLDCDDLNPAIHPDAGEVCSGNVDDDCDTAFDCADSDCAGRACGVGGTCMGMLCLAPTEAGLCADGVDNDGDGPSDCLDADCPAGSMCSDSNGCTLSDTCAGDGGCESAALRVCSTPPAPQCWAAMGTCQSATASCLYAVLADAGCDDGLKCTVDDRCSAAGACGGAAVACASPPSVCHALSGTCLEALDGGCAYPPLASGPCDDLDDCTVNDGCDGDGGCSGSRVPCPAPSVCLASTGCRADGGCLFSALTGQACDGGVCTDGGACAPHFSYPPSNFDPSVLPAAPRGGLSLVCGNTDLNTSLADGGFSWVNPCVGQDLNPAHVFLPGGPRGTLLLFYDSVNAFAGSSLRLFGERPVILAVKGNVTVGGALLALQNIDCAVGNGGDGGSSSNPLTAGGGGGGAFGSDGGEGNDGWSVTGTKGSRGLSHGTPALVPLDWGCRGGNGGLSNGTNGRGGFGGGAVQVSSGGTLTVTGTGTVSAPGRGGAGGLGNSHIAGGGGGSGGAILLEGVNVVLAAMSAVTANGGAGGEGSGIGAGSPDGCTGETGHLRDGSAAVGQPATCTRTDSCGGVGGNGAALSSAAQSGAQANCLQTSEPSAGGGGGGVGRIRVNASAGCMGNMTAVVSPAPSGNGATGCPAN